MEAKHNTPKYRRHRSGGLDRSFVELNGRRIYLGRWRTPASREKYDRVLAKWLANGRRLRRRGPNPTVAELLAAFWHHAEERYQSREAENFRSVIKLLRRLYGRTRIADFSAQDLKAVRGRMIADDLSRKYINRQVVRIRSIFAWGVDQGMVPAETLVPLGAVAGLRYGDARETEPVRPVPAAYIRAVRPHVSGQVWAMIDLQRLTGMRPGEVVAMRGRDLDTNGKVWAYTPAHHKTAHHGHGRIVYLGPRAQTIMQPFLRRELTTHLFSPADAEADRRKELHRRRRTPLSCGNRPGSNRLDSPGWPGDHYTVNTYRQAIARACGVAGVDPWSPGQLRHNAATRLRREYGLELAQTILGHRIGSAITEIYAEANTRRAIDVVRRIG